MVFSLRRAPSIARHVGPWSVHPACQAVLLPSCSADRWREPVVSVSAFWLLRSLSVMAYRPWGCKGSRMDATELSCKPLHSQDLGKRQFHLESEPSPEHRGWHRKPGLARSLFQFKRTQWFSIRKWRTRLSRAGFSAQWPLVIEMRWSGDGCRTKDVKTSKPLALKQPLSSEEQENVPVYSASFIKGQCHYVSLLQWVWHSVVLYFELPEKGVYPTRAILDPPVPLRVDWCKPSFSSTVPQGCVSVLCERLLR